MPFGQQMANTRTVRPSVASDLSRSRSHRIFSGSSPLIGSSKINTSGSPSSTAAIPRRCPMPRQKLPARQCPTPPRPTMSNTTSTRCVATALEAASQSRWLRTVRPGHMTAIEAIRGGALTGGYLDIGCAWLKHHANSSDRAVLTRADRYVACGRREPARTARDLQHVSDQLLTMRRPVIRTSGPGRSAVGRPLADRQGGERPLQSLARGAKRL